MRPGAGPPPRRRRRPLGPTPRYAFIPRWGLLDPATQVFPAAALPSRRGPSLRAIRATLITTVVVLGVAALLHIARYALLIINRQVLLNSVVAVLGTWLPVAASVAAMFAIVGCAFALTEWLIGRRAAAFGHRDAPDPRPVWALRAGCLVPLANLVWAPTYVVELATVEERYPLVRRLIWAWSLLFAFSTAGVGVRDRNELSQRHPGHRQQHRQLRRRLPDGYGGDCRRRRDSCSRSRAHPSNAPPIAGWWSPTKKNPGPIPPVAVEQEGQEPAA